MAKISKTVEIGAPVEQVYGFLTNPNNLPEIFPSLIEVSNVERDADGKSSFDWVYKMAGVHLRGGGVTTEMEPNRHVVVKNHGGIPSEFDYRYESVGGTTRVTLNIEYTIPGQVLGKLADPIVHRINEHEAETMLQNLKARMELGAEAPAEEIHAVQ